MKQAPKNFILENQIVQVDLLDKLCSNIEDQIRKGRNHLYVDEWLSKSTLTILRLYGYNLTWSNYGVFWEIKW